jgi:hypothetical protein
MRHFLSCSSFSVRQRLPKFFETLEINYLFSNLSYNENIDAVCALASVNGMPYLVGC